MVAEAFLVSDDRVRQAQSVLDQATADRSRILAAFSVTVGSDGAVAEMLGLNEREVRVTRRTVGKEDARAVAEELLSHAARQPAPPEPAPEDPVEPVPAPPAPEPVPGVPGGHGVHGAPQAAYPPAGPPVAAMGPDGEIVWSPALDAVLVDAWQTQVDLSVLAVELGLDLPRLTARAQQLSAEGRLVCGLQPTDQAGRHRRQSGSGPGHIPPQPNGDPSQAPPPGPPLDSGAAWQQWHWQTPPGTPQWGSPTLPAHDWDGILTQWQTTPPQTTGSWAGAGR